MQIDTETLQAPVDQLPQMKAVVIDDAFDSVYSSDVAVDELRAKYQIAADTDHDLEAALLELKIDINAHSEIVDDADDYLKLLQQLWEQKDNPKVSGFITEVFAEKLTRMQYIVGICRNIEQQELEVITVDSKTEDFSRFNDDSNCRIIFLDYNLGPNPGESAVANARKKAHAIYEAFPDQTKPMIILMSSYENVGDEVEKFKKEADLGDVVFRFAPKTQLSNNNIASLLVKAYKSESEQVHKLQKYITSLKKSAGDAFKTFKEDVSKLTIDDYAFIHQTIVKGQAHPLGDYLGWLYSGHWANLLTRTPELKVEKDSLDKVFQDVPSFHYSIPTTKMVEIYMSGVFEDGLGEIEEFHPLSGHQAGDPEVELAKLPYLHLGDIFSKDGDGTLWMVLNPQCDLERADERLGEYSILLVPGILSPIEPKAASPAGQKTELIIIDDKRYRVIWKPKNIKTLPLKDINKWREENQMKRKFRLRLPYALEIQQAFTSTISRVGLPVPPGFAQELEVQVLFKVGRNKMEPILDRKNSYAFVAVTRKLDKKIRFTLNFATDLKLAIEAKIESLSEQQEMADGTNNSIADDKQKLETLLSQFDEWFFNSHMQDFPEQKKIKDSISNLMGIVQDYKPTMDISKLAVVINVFGESDQQPSAPE